MRSHNISNYHRELLSAVIVLGLIASSAFITSAQTGEPSRAPILLIETGMHTAVIKQIGLDAANRLLVTASHDKTVESGNSRPEDCCASSACPSARAKKAVSSASPSRPTGALLPPGGGPHPTD
jgi:hypothetical protein